MIALFIIFILSYFIILFLFFNESRKNLFLEHQLITLEARYKKLELEHTFYKKIFDANNAVYKK